MSPPCPDGSHTYQLFSRIPSPVTRCTITILLARARFLGSIYHFLGLPISILWIIRPLLGSVVSSHRHKGKQRKIPITMPSFLNSHAKTRARSVQLQLDRESSAAAAARARPSVQVVTSPFPGIRSSSLPGQENQPPSNRPYGSMLNIDAPVLSLLTPLTPLVYDNDWPDSFAGHGTTKIPTGSCNTLLADITDGHHVVCIV